MLPVSSGCIILSSALKTSGVEDAMANMPVSSALLWKKVAHLCSSLLPESMRSVSGSRISQISAGRCLGSFFSRLSMVMTLARLAESMAVASGSTASSGPSARTRIAAASSSGRFLSWRMLVGAPTTCSKRMLLKATPGRSSCSLRCRVSTSTSESTWTVLPRAR